MNYHKRHRANLTKRFYMRGYEKFTLGKDEITLHTTGIVKKLSIQGNTYQSEIPTVSNPIQIQSMKGNGVNITVKGINVFNAKDKKTSSYKGLVLESENNIFAANGKCTEIASNGLVYSVNGLKPNTEYSVRFSKISGEFTDSDIRLYHFYQNPLTFKKVLHLYGSDSISVSVKTFTFTQEEIESGVSLGVYFINKTLDAEFKNYRVRVDIVEGKFTEKNFPDYQPYIAPKTTKIDTELNGIDGYNDTLTLDYEKNTVEIVRKVKTITVADFLNENSLVTGEDGQRGIFVGCMSDYEVNTKPYCTHCKSYETNELIYDTCFEFAPSNNGSDLYFYWIEQKTVEEFYDWAKENCVRIAYVSNETETEKIDLNLPVEFLRNGVTSVISTEGSNKIEAVYYDSKI